MAVAVAESPRAPGRRYVAHDQLVARWRLPLDPHPFRIGKKRRDSRIFQIEMTSKPCRFMIGSA